MTKVVKPRKFVAALSGDGPGLISVIVDTWVEAKSKIIHELSKPGREEVLSQWKRNGSHIMVDK